MYFKRLVSFQMHTNRVFNGLRLIETAKQSLLHPEGGYSQKIWVGVCGPLPKTLTLFMTKLCDIDPYPIYDLTKNLMPYLWPERYIKILFWTRDPMITRVLLKYPRYHWIPSSDQC